MSVPQAKRTVTSEIPSRLTLSIPSMPGTPLIACSIRSLTKRSTSAGALPVISVWITRRG